VSCGTATKAEPARTKTSPSPPKLTATVSASSVALTTASGRSVSRLPSGWYTIAVHLDSGDADFHLIGPNVERTASASGSIALWGVHLLKGTYRYMDDRNGRGRASTHVISVY